MAEPAPSSLHGMVISGEGNEPSAHEVSAQMQTEVPTIESRVRALGRALCLLGASLGALGIVAWLLGMKRVLTVFPGLPPMMPASAIALLLLGIAAALVLTARHGRTPRLFAMIAAMVVLAVSLETIAEYVLNIHLFWDPLVLDRSGRYYSGSSAPPTAVALALLATAVLLADVGSGKRFRPSEWLIVAALLIPTTALLGYLYGAASPYRLTGTPVVGVLAPSMRLIRVVGNHLVIGTSFSTAVALALISIGLFVGRPDWGTMSIVAGRGPGTLLVQRLAPLAILVPIGFGVIASRLPGTEDAPFVLAGLTDGSMILTLSILGITGARLNRGHDTLVQERARTSELIDLASDGILMADVDGRLTEVNEAACRIQGYSREEMLTKSFWDLIPPEDEERLRRHRTGLLEGQTVTDEWTAVKKDGTRFPVEVSAKVLPSRRWQAIVRDISERKRLEEVLRLSEIEHRLLAQFATVLAETLSFDHMLTKIAQLFSREPGDLCIVDTVADDGSIRRAAVACRDPLEQSLCDALMRPPLDGEGARTIRPEIAAGELVLFHKPTPDVIGFLAPDPDARTALKDVQSVVLAPLLAHGRFLGAVSLVSLSRVFNEYDLRMMRAASRVAALMLDNARLYAAANQARKARDDMLGVVAHDLRNPLTVIAAYGAALKPGAEREIGEQIERASKRMSRLIQDLIDVTRLEVRPLTLKRSMLPSNKVLSDVFASQVPLASSASLEIRLDAAPDLPDIWADHDRLLQVFENLIGNAIKFSKPGGYITLAARASPSEVLFSVADTGSGIGSTHLPHVFDRFWQGPGAGRRGVGLGLPIVKGIVEAHGGRVWVESSPGHGSTFFFTIPTGPIASVPQAIGQHRRTTVGSR